MRVRVYTCVQRCELHTYCYSQWAQIIHDTMKASQHVRKMQSAPEKFHMVFSSLLGLFACSTTCLQSHSDDHVPKLDQCLPTIHVQTDH